VRFIQIIESTKRQAVKENKRQEYWQVTDETFNGNFIQRFGAHSQTSDGHTLNASGHNNRVLVRRPKSGRDEE
jgi:hypothetical protein